jgi:restriction system protein
MMNAWILRPYPYGIYRMSQFVNENFIAIGWPGIGNMYSSDRSDIYQKVLSLYLSDYGDQYCRDSSNTIWKFREQILTGELVLVVPFQEDGLEIAVGRVDSSYFFDARFDETATNDTGYNGFSHRRKVIWLEKRLPRSLLPVPIKKTFTKEILHTLNLEGYNRLIELLETRGHNLNERWTMSEHRQNLVENSINLVLNAMQQKTPELANIFEAIAQEVFEIFKESKSIHFDLLRSRITHLASGIDAHLIPIDDNKASCQKHCLSMALDKWKAQEGFREIAKQTMNYWLQCLDENNGTLFFTSAWDEIDFLENFKSQIDAYAKKHQIAIILMTAHGFSITYIK